MRLLDSQELQSKTAEFRRRLKAGAALDSLLVEGASPCCCVTLPH